MFQTATSGKFAKPHCKTTPPGFWCNSWNLFSKESQRESQFLRGHRMRTKDSVYIYIKQVGRKFTGSFSQLKIKWNFVADYSTISDSGALLIERILVFQGISILVPSSGLRQVGGFLFRQGQSSNLPKGINSFWGI